jgi:hypothetical protein
MEDNDRHRDAAHDFMKACGLDPTPDAIGQLSGPFLEALEIICTRGYSPGQSFFWQKRGWKGLVHDILDNSLRLRLFSWERNSFYPNAAVDMINFCGFYLRLKNAGPKWGELGEPG